MNKRSLKKIFSYFCYIPKIPKIILLIKNWPSYFLNWLGITKRNVTYYFRNGYKIKTVEAIDVCTINGIFIIEQYKNATENYNNTTNPVVIDLGANIGLFSIYTKMKIPNAEIFAYEPVPKNFDILLENIKKNDLKKITPYCLGISGKEEKRYLYLEDSVSHSIYLNNQNKGKQCINITCITLEKILRDNKIDICDILKIDTEGSEYEILYNCSRNTLERIKKIILECHHIKSFENYNKKSMEKFLIDNEFSISDVDENIIYAVNKKNK
ncbi:MAG: FkbM family methyltransferase [Patescibacteria group bacterium]|nr:FkbM family methyltransferase [Patescibacteria group bacterium]